MDCVEGDITQLDVEAIVNAANDRLARGGGVCGAIHEAAGREIAEACRKIGGFPTGQARVQPGFKLDAKVVCLPVGLMWHAAAIREDALLADAYRNSLELSRQHKVASIAFPAISTGIYGYPLERATDIAVHAVADFLRASEVPARVVFACFGAEVAAGYRGALASLR